MAYLFPGRRLVTHRICFLSLWHKASPPALGATALLVKNTGPARARSILVGGRQKASDLFICTITLAVPSLSNFLQCSSFKSCFIIFRQANIPRMLEKHWPFLAYCGCSGSSCYYVYMEKFKRKWWYPVKEWHHSGWDSVPPTSTSATEHICHQYKLVKKYFNRIYCTELGCSTAYYNAKIFV